MLIRSQFNKQAQPVIEHINWIRPPTNHNILHNYYSEIVSNRFHQQHNINI